MRCLMVSHDPQQAGRGQPDAPTPGWATGTPGRLSSPARPSLHLSKGDITNRPPRFLIPTSRLGLCHTLSVMPSLRGCPEPLLSGPPVFWGICKGAMIMRASEEGRGVEDSEELVEQRVVEGLEWSTRANAGGGTWRDEAEASEGVS